MPSAEPMPKPMENQEKELEILENIYSSHTDVRQRDLARIVGLSLGMTNAILKRLAQKGLLKISKVNNRNIRYVVSPKGIEAITRRSYRYFKRTIKNVVYYRESIEKLVKEIKKQQYSGVMLVGPSDLDFIVEHACYRFDVRYLKDDSPIDGRVFTVYSESYIPDRESVESAPAADAAFLQDILLKVSP